MVTRIIRFFNVIMVALVSGTIFGIWIGYNPKNLSAPTFIEQQQNVITNLNTLMPILGLMAIINGIIMTWDMHNPPTNWIELRDQWWAYHKIRTLTAFIGLCFIVWTSIKQD